MAPCNKCPVARAAASLAHGFLAPGSSALGIAYCGEGMESAVGLLKLGWIQLGFSPSPLLNPNRCFVLLVFILGFSYFLFFSSWLSVLTETQASGISFPIPINFS